MHKNSRNTELSSFLTQKPSTTPPRPVKIPAANFMQELETAMEAGDDVRTLEVLDAAPQWIKKQPDFMLTRATVLMNLDEDQEAIRLLREIERKNPRYTALYAPLSMLYMDKEWPAHALQAAKRALADRDLDNETRTSLEQLIEEATAYIQIDARGTGLSFEMMQRACLFNEQAQIAMEDNLFSEVDRYAKEAIKIAPNWNPPYNNRAQALFFSGGISEAISVSEGVLAREAENVFALSKLVIYHLSLNQPEQAQQYAHRLGLLSKKLPAGTMEFEQIVLSLAACEDTPALWKIAKRYLEAPPDIFISRSWQSLAVAAIRSRKWAEALQLMNNIDQEELSPAAKKLKDELELVVAQRQPCLSWMPPAYPVADLFFHDKVFDEWAALLQDFSDPVSPSQKRKLDSFIQKYPFMVVGMRHLLWEEESHSVAVQMLILMATPEADAEIVRFASSQTGSRQTRLQAMMELLQTKRYTGSKGIKLWDEDLNEWRNVELNSQQIGDVEPNAQPETMVLIKKAQRAKNPQEAITLLKQAVEREPTSPIALFNLGVKLVESGKEEEGEALILHSVEADPNYTYGHAAIALSEAEENHEQQALAHLAVVTQAEIIAPETAILTNIAYVILALRKGDLESARQRLEIAAKINPEHRLVKRFNETLKDAEEYKETFGFLLEYQRKSAQRAHQKLLKTPLMAEMNLLACLKTNSKEMLVGSAHFLRTTASGKKDELASWLAEVLLDPEFLQQTLEEDLEKKERSALQWVLESGGVRPWKDFVLKYGEEVNESTHWDYHEPESIPGRLRMSGLFYSGILEEQQVAFIPMDVRPLLGKLLK